MGGNSPSTPESGPSPVITPQMMQSISGPPRVDPLSYSDPTTTPDPLIEAIKSVVGLFGYGPTPPTPPKR